MRPVLYAEDDPDDVFFLRLAWEKAEVPNTLVAVPNGQEAIDYLTGGGRFARGEPPPFPCLLILDINLPVRNGLEVLNWIKHHELPESLPVLILSGSNQDCDFIAARTFGVVEYVVKPSSPAALLEIVQRAKDTWLGEGSAPD